MSTWLAVRIRHSAGKHGSCHACHKLQLVLGYDLLLVTWVLHIEIKLTQCLYALVGGCRAWHKRNIFSWTLMSISVSETVVPSVLKGQRLKLALLGKHDGEVLLVVWHYYSLSPFIWGNNLFNECTAHCLNFAALAKDLKNSDVCRVCITIKNLEEKSILHIKHSPILVQC